jgi:50S ribosomal subunit-associated GTPase HflX
MSDADNNSEHSDSDESRSSHESVETLVSTEEQNRRLREQVEALTAELKKKRKKHADEKASHRKSSTTPKVPSVSLSLAQKPKVFEVNSNKNLSEIKLHEHLETIKSHKSGIGGTK